MNSIQSILEQNEFLALAIAHIVAVASPGPDFAVVTKNTIQSGKRIGRMTALGVGVAILLHVTYALLGFSVLVKSNETLFTIIKWIGALFLIYLGVMSLKAKGGDTISSKNNQTTEQQNPWKAFRQGFFTNALNVKAMLFFLFLFTSLVSEKTTTATKAFYGVWLSVITFLWFYFIATIIGWQPVRNFFNQFGSQFDKIMGILFIGLAILLIIK